MFSNINLEMFSNISKKVYYELYNEDQMHLSMLHIAPPETAVLSPQLITPEVDLTAAELLRSRLGALSDLAD